jgi:tetratricopeptide (TPR) repeat protein
LTRSEIELPDHPVMELAGAFANRRLQYLRREYPHVPEGVLMLADRAIAYDRRGDLQTARRLLETTTALAPTFASAQAQLAVLYDRTEERDLAIDRYRRAVDAQPPYVRGELMQISTSAGFMEVRQLALNNLAYDLAVYRRAPEEALPLARRALAYGADYPELLDTIGWIEQLLGDDESAMQHLRLALSRVPSNAAVRLHAAVVAATLNASAEAERYLAMALQVDPAPQTSQDAAAVRGILRAPR